MPEHKLIYPNPEKQEMFDLVLERLMNDEKYLHFAFSLTELSQGLYDTTYQLVTYRLTPEEKEEQRKKMEARSGKYAAKFF